LSNKIKFKLYLSKNAFLTLVVRVEICTLEDLVPQEFLLFCSNIVFPL
jgi:hypothetical protein